ncbi:hypothetical protein [Pseudomonas sp. RIT-PI-AD]|uniref:hypothetical protein n=1 Tax=Pseudomonas sp. RIT-PI-AD TaxID=3035294 RepID=UPI0021D88BE9|nr:hypothetical protein [Pseudomonas sp. RIT-PI-AD]
MTPRLPQAVAIVDLNCHETWVTLTPDADGRLHPGDRLVREADVIELLERLRVDASAIPADQWDARALDLARQLWQLPPPIPAG